MTAEASDPSQIDRARSLPDGPVSQYTDRVVAELDSQELSPQQRTQVMGDHLIGSIFRSQGASKGVETISDISDVAGRTDITDPTGNEAVSWLRTITRNRGVRRAVMTVDAVPNGSAALGNLITRVRVEHGKPETATMTTMDQIVAYVDTITPEEARLPIHERPVPWKQAIIEELRTYLQTPGRKEAWHASENLGSDVDTIRRSQETWERAAGIAGRASLDIGMITRSAEFIRQQQEAGRDVGHVALMEIQPDYGSLLGD